VKSLVALCIALTLAVSTIGGTARTATGPDLLLTPQASLACLSQSPPRHALTARCVAAGVPIDVLRGPGRSAQPVIIWMHGGAWLFGSSTDIDGAISDQVARGWTVISVDYHVGNGATIAEMADEVRTVVRWTRAHAWALNIDPGSVVLAGTSAGGHLAALAGLAPGQDLSRLPERLRVHSARPNGIIAMSGIYDLRSYDVTVAMLGSMQELLVVATGCTPRPALPLRCSTRFLGRLSPVTKASGGDPPVLVVHGIEDDVAPVQQARALRAALVAKQVPATLALWHEDHCVEIDHTHRTVEAWLDLISRAGRATQDADP
jgi:acetyl esterase/lipase